VWEWELYKKRSKRFLALFVILKGAAVFVDRYGKGVDAIRPIDLHDEALEQARNLVALKLDAMGVPHNVIAKYLGMSRMTVWRRLRGISSDVERCFFHASLGELFQDLSDEDQDEDQETER
jgi:hypothetical protein